MKKAFNVIIKILKGYLVFNTLCLAFIGAGEVVDEYKKHPEESIIDNDGNAFRNAIDKFKKYWKGEA